MLELFGLMQHDSGVIGEASLLLIRGLSDVRALAHAAARTDASMRIAVSAAGPRVMILTEHLRDVLTGNWADR